MEYVTDGQRGSLPYAHCTLGVAVSVRALSNWCVSSAFGCLQRAALILLIPTSLFAQMQVPPPTGDTKAAAEFMFQQPVHNDKEAGGFYVASLADGTTFILNIYYGERVFPGSLLDPRSLDGRVITFEVKSEGNQFSLDVERSGNTQNAVIDAAVSAYSPTYGHGTFFVPARMEKADWVMRGSFSNDRQTADGVVEDRIHHNTQGFVLRRKFVYEKISKKWPIYEDPENHSNIAFAQFLSIFPEIQWAAIRDQVLSDASVCFVDRECTNEVSILSYNDDLLTLRVMQIDKAEGVQAEYGSKYLVFDTSRSPAAQVARDAFLKSSNECQERLQKITGSRLQAVLVSQNSERAFTAAVEHQPANYSDSFIVNKEGITLHYTPTSLSTSMGEGEFFVTLTRQELGDCFTFPKRSK